MRVNLGVKSQIDPCSKVDRGGVKKTGVKKGGIYPPLLTAPCFLTAHPLAREKKDAL